MEKGLKVKPELGAIVELYTTLLKLRSLWKSLIIIKPISFVGLLTLENILT